MKKSLTFFIILILVLIFPCSAEEKLDVEDNGGAAVEKNEFEVQEITSKTVAESIQENEKTVEEEKEFGYRSDEEFSFTGLSDKWGNRVGGLKLNYGPRVGWLFFDFSSINEVLVESDAGFAPLEEKVFVKGSGGLIGFKPGFRLGYSRREGSLNSLGNFDGEQRKILFDFNYSGLSLEQGIYSELNTDIAFGGKFGTGSVSLDFVYENPVEFDPELGGTQTRLAQEFLVFKPYISLNHRFSGFLGLNMSAGYLFSYSREGWQLSGQEIKTPFQELWAPEINLGLYIGF